MECICVDFRRFCALWEGSLLYLHGSCFSVNALYSQIHPLCMNQQASPWITAIVFFAAWLSLIFCVCVLRCRAVKRWFFFFWGEFKFFWLVDSLLCLDCSDLFLSSGYEACSFLTAWWWISFVINQFYLDIFVDKRRSYLFWCVRYVNFWNANMSNTGFIFWGKYSTGLVDWVTFLVILLIIEIQIFIGEKLCL